MGLAKFWQRQRMIDSGEIRPRVLKPRKRKMPKNSVSEQDLTKMPPLVLGMIDDVAGIKDVLVDTSRNLEDRFKETNKSRDSFDINNKLWCVVYDVNKFIEKKCKLLDKMKRQIIDSELQKLSLNNQTSGDKND